MSGGIIAAAVVALVVALAVAQFGVRDSTQPPESTVDVAARRLSEELRIEPDVVATERAVVERVIDGDTLVVTLAGRAQTIRLYGLQAPERDERCFGEASLRLTDLSPPASVVLRHPGPRNDDGTRLLRYVFLTDGLSLSAVLVSEGLAEAWRRDGQLRDQIVGLEGGGARVGAEVSVGVGRVRGSVRSLRLASLAQDERKRASCPAVISRQVSR